MTANRWQATLTGLSSTAGTPLYFPDVAAPSPFNLTMTTNVNSGIGYNLEVSLDHAGLSTPFVSSLATWFSSLASALSTNALIAIATPVRAIRLNAVSGSSTSVIVATIQQAG